MTREREGEEESRRRGEEEEGLGKGEGDREGEEERDVKQDEDYNDDEEVSEISKNGIVYGEGRGTEERSDYNYFNLEGNTGPLVYPAGIHPHRPRYKLSIIFKITSALQTLSQRTRLDPKYCPFSTKEISLLQAML